MTTALDVARYFLGKQDHESGEIITNMKLQKLLYYAQGFHLAMHGRPLFPERIKAWDHGPVVPQVWHEFKQFAGNPLPAEAAESKLDPEVRELLDEVYSVYGQYSAWRLRELSHDEPPWAEAYNTTGIVHNETMRRYFRTRLVDA